MSQSKNAVELFSILVDEIYGELASRIMTILFRRGRLPIQTLSRHTRLTTRQLKHGLSVLIQQRLVYFYEDGHITYYEANQDAAYALIRQGKFMEIVESRHGIIARDLVHDLFLMGHAKVSDLVESYEARKHIVQEIPSTNRETANGTNGGSKARSVSAAKLRSTLVELLDAGIMKLSHKGMFRSPTDVRNDVETQLLDGKYSGSAKGPKQKINMREDLNSKLRDIEFEAPTWNGSGNTQNGYTNGNHKRVKLSNGNGPINGHHDSYEDEKGNNLDQGIIIHLNYDKLAVALRNEQLVELASARIGSATSLVYAEFLKILEPKIPRCREYSKAEPREDRGDIYTAKNTELFSVFKDLANDPHGVNPSLGIGKPDSNSSIKTEDLDRPQEPRKRRVSGVKTEEVSGNGQVNAVIRDVAMDQTGVREDSQDPFTNSKKDSKPKRKHLTEDKFTFDEKKEHIKDHLRLLAQDDAGFLRLCGQGEWTVDFEWLADFSRDVEVNSYIRENFGSEGHRIVKILRKFGKLEDKGLPHLALMTPKNLRTTLARMQMAGMVDIQAVPRDAGHTNARTIFLWHFDVERITEILLDKIYKAMSRHLQRLEIERRKASGIISLSQRADVVAGKSALNAYQMGLLTEYRQLEAKFTIQLMRLDGLVGIFRDF